MIEGTDSTQNACGQLHQHISVLPKFPIAGLPTTLPLDGVYFLFEKGELGHGMDRIVRIGSHTGQGNLAARLREHLTLNKDRSIFRKHIGRALLKRQNDPYAEIWEIDFTTREEREKKGHLRNESRQQEIEAAVSAYIEKNFRVCVISMPDADAAIELEELCIATVASCDECSASISWLGRAATHEKIRESGLWQIQHLNGSRHLTSEHLEEIRRGAHISIPGGSLI